MSRTAVLVSGNGSNLQALIDSEARTKLSLVVSNNPDAYALKRAERAGIETSTLKRTNYSERDHFDKELARMLVEKGISLVVLAGWMHILGPHYLENFPGETINLHPALPGAYPGINSIERAFRDGVSETGCMVHRVTEEVDVGEVLGVSRVPIYENDTLELLTNRMHKAEHQLLCEVVLNLHKDFILT